MSKIVWGVFLALVGLVALWQGGKGFFAFREYTQKCEMRPVHIEKMSAIPIKGRYGVEVVYSYEMRGKFFSCTALLPKPYFYHERAALDEIARREGMRCSAWVDPKHPRQSILDKRFPFRDLVYGICSVGVFGYFLYLRFHLTLLAKS